MKLHSKRVKIVGIKSLFSKKNTAGKEPSYLGFKPSGEDLIAFFEEGMVIETYSRI